VKSDDTLKSLRKMAKKGETETLQTKLTELKCVNSITANETNTKILKIYEIFKGQLAKIAAFTPREVNHRGGKHHGKHGRRHKGRHHKGKGFFGRFFDSSESSGQTSEGTSSDDDSKAKGQPFKVFLAGWLSRFENLLKTENPFVAMRQARFRAKNLLKRIPRGNGNVRRAMHILREGKWAVKGFLHEHKGICKMIKNKKMSKELLTQRWTEISAKRPGLVKKLDKVMAVLKEIH